ncbi:hypothetical protein [Nocardia asteroides]
MIAMSHMLLSTSMNDTVAAEYEPAQTTENGRQSSAHVRLRLGGGYGMAAVFLDIEHVRELALVLPDILMTHDAAEHAAKERAAAVAESRVA